MSEEPVPPRPDLRLSLAPRGSETPPRATPDPEPESDPAAESDPRNAAPSGDPGLAGASPGAAPAAPSSEPPAPSTRRERSDEAARVRRTSNSAASAADARRAAARGAGAAAREVGAAATSTEAAIGLGVLTGGGSAAASLAEGGVKAAATGAAKSAATTAAETAATSGARAAASEAAANAGTAAKGVAARAAELRTSEAARSAALTEAKGLAVDAGKRAAASEAKDLLHGGSHESLGAAGPGGDRPREPRGITRSDHGSYTLRVANARARKTQRSDTRADEARARVENASGGPDDRGRAEKRNDRSTARTGIDATEAANVSAVAKTSFAATRQVNRARRLLPIALVVVLTLVVLSFTMIGAVVGGYAAAEDAAADDSSSYCVLPDGSTPGTTNGVLPVGSLNPSQAQIASTIIGVAKGLGIGRDGMKIAIMVGMQESTLRNIDYGDRDSVGVFQQRALWGPTEKRMNVAQSATMFFTGGDAGQRGLLDVPNWQLLPPYAAGQSVQASFDGATAGKATYGRWDALASGAVTALEPDALVLGPFVDVAPPTDVDSDFDACSTTGTGGAVGSPVVLDPAGGGASSASVPCPSGTEDAGLDVGPGNVVLHLCTVSPGMRLDATAAGNAAALLAAARADGVTLGGSAYRSNAVQISLRKKNCGAGWATVRSSSCSPPTALPGKSQHEWGLAIDFSNCGSRGTTCYRWLAGNAGRFGFINLPSESWHWSTTGK